VENPKLFSHAVFATALVLGLLTIPATAKAYSTSNIILWVPGTADSLDHSGVQQWVSVPPGNSSAYPEGRGPAITTGCASPFSDSCMLFVNSWGTGSLYSNNMANYPSWTVSLWYRVLGKNKADDALAEITGNGRGNGGLDIDLANNVNYVFENLEPVQLENYTQARLWHYYTVSCSNGNAAVYVDGYLELAGVSCLPAGEGQGNSSPTGYIAVGCRQYNGKLDCSTADNGGEINALSMLNTSVTSVEAYQLYSLEGDPYASTGDWTNYLYALLCSNAQTRQLLQALPGQFDDYLYGVAVLLAIIILAYAWKEWKKRELWAA
jgi:hypothetical protein